MDSVKPCNTEIGINQPEMVVPVKKTHLFLKNRAFYVDILRTLLLISSGSVICAWVINGILIPHQFLSGGISGLALIVHYLFPGISLGMLFILFNIPIFISGWVYVGRRFFFYSVIGLLIFSLAVEVLKPACPIQDKMLSALFAGIVFGFGSGLILRSRGSAGGTDILSIILLKRYSIKIGSTVLMFNGGILLGSVFLFSLEAVLYTLVFMFVTSHVVELVVSGLSKRKAVFIISSHWEQISSEIMSRMNRGVTIIRGQGGFSKQDESILYTVITFQELPKLKDMIRQIDENPFIVVSDTLEVIGQRIGNQPQW